VAHSNAGFVAAWNGKACASATRRWIAGLCRLSAVLDCSGLNALSEAPLGFDLETQVAGDGSDNADQDKVWPQDPFRGSAQSARRRVDCHQLHEVKHADMHLIFKTRAKTLCVAASTCARVRLAIGKTCGLPQAIA